MARRFICIHFAFTAVSEFLLENEFETLCRKIMAFLSYVIWKKKLFIYFLFWLKEVYKVFMNN